MNNTKSELLRVLARINSITVGMTAIEAAGVAAITTMREVQALLTAKARTIGGISTKTTTIKKNRGSLSIITELGMIE